MLWVSLRWNGTNCLTNGSRVGKTGGNHNWWWSQSQRRNSQTPDDGRLFLELNPGYIIMMLQNVLWYLYYLGTDLSAQELLEKYGDPTLVDDLISRKTEAKLFQADPNFPDKEDQVESKPDKFIDFMFYLQDLRVYLCWAENVQEDADSRLKSIATTSSGALDNASAASSWQWGTYIDIETMKRLFVAKQI